MVQSRPFAMLRLRWRLLLARAPSCLHCVKMQLYPHGACCCSLSHHWCALLPQPSVHVASTLQQKYNDLKDIKVEKKEKKKKEEGEGGAGERAWLGRVGTKALGLGGVGSEARLEQRRQSGLGWGGWGQRSASKRCALGYPGAGSTATGGGGVCLRCLQVEARCSRGR